jgi:aspartyl-tRNA synthetase
MQTIAGMMIELFQHLQAKFQPEIEAVRRQYPSEPFLFSQQPLVLQYPQAVAMLREAGVEQGDEEVNINSQMGIKNVKISWNQKKIVIRNF